MIGERVFLTPEQAIAMLPEGDEIHTFVNPAGMLVGADWSRTSIEKAIRETDRRELAGSLATGMGHGLLINDGGRLVFIATRKEPS